MKKYTLLLTLMAVVISFLTGCTNNQDPMFKKGDGVTIYTPKTDTAHSITIADSTLNRFSYFYTDWYRFEHTNWLGDTVFGIPNPVWLLLWSVIGFLVCFFVIKKIRQRRATSQRTKEFHTNQQEKLPTADKKSGCDKITVRHSNNRELIVSGKNITEVHIS